MKWEKVALPVEHVGKLLQLARQSRDIRPCALSDAMGAQGYALSLADYEEMESGANLPNDGDSFLNAYQVAMHLDRGELRLIETQWAFDVLRQHFSEAFARRILETALKGGLDL
jgi:hypothetical protein